MVSKTSLDTDIHTLVYNRITDSTNGITDSESPARERTSFVFIQPSDATMSSRAFRTYPIILMDSPTSPFIQEYIGYKIGSKPTITFKIKADSASKLKALTDALKSWLSSNNTYWEQNGLHEIEIYDVTAGGEVSGNTSLHIRFVNVLWSWSE